MGQHVFRLPDVGEGIAEAEIVAWHVKSGDVVKEDQPLIDVMTDKATVEITSPVSGQVVSTTGAVGENVAIGSSIVVFELAESPEADVSSSSAPSQPKDISGDKHGESVKAAPEIQPTPPPQRAGVAGRPVQEKPQASPAVRRRAYELGIPLQFISGTGPDGRITQEDLSAYISAGPKAVPGTIGAFAPALAVRDGIQDVKIVGLRRKIAQKMQDAKRHIPHFTYVEEVDMTALEDLRKYLNAKKQSHQPNLTVLPFLIRALVQVLPTFPQINATFDDEAGVVSQYAPVHIGMATQTDNGLIVPVIRHAEGRDLWGLASEIARLAKATREGSATREELSGSTITITSLGPLGGLMHTPVINRPEVAIVGPNRIAERPVVIGGQVTVRKMMMVSSSFDHRIVDGQQAALFIQDLKQLLEHPAALFIG